MHKNLEKNELELSPELLLQRERGSGRCRSKRAYYADINLIVSIKRTINVRVFLSLSQFR